MKESKKPPNFVDLLVNRAIAPSHPSMIPVINTKIEKHRRFLKLAKEKKLKMEKRSIITVAKFGVTLTLIKPLAISFTNHPKIFLTLNTEGMLKIVL
jgi:hypothetical protein